MEYVIETHNLTKKYGTKNAVDKVNMHVSQGDIYGFIGRNGAGKTTAMKLILGIANITDGSVELFGSKDLNKARKRIGSLIETPALYKNCSAYQNLKRFSYIYGGDENEIQEILKIIGLADTGNKKAGQFSLGMKQRLGIGIALLGKPELLILDEPINGLDPVAIKEVRDMLLKLNSEKGITMLISSHLLDELAKITTKYGIINNGNLIEEISAQELENRCKSNIKIVVDRPKEALEMLIENSVVEKDLATVSGNTLILFNDKLSSAEINKMLVKKGFEVSAISISEEGLENYFIERLGK